MWTAQFIPAKPGSTFGTAHATFNDQQGIAVITCSFNLDVNVPAEVSAFVSECKKLLTAKQTADASAASIITTIETELNK